MSELSDLEIRKMITEIEIKRLFLKAKSVEFDRTQNCYWINVVGFESYPLLNPLTDDALCFRLMIKHDINLTSMGPSLKDCSDGYEYHCYEQGAYINASSTLSISKNPNKAICLAIIESKAE